MGALSELADCEGASAMLLQGWAGAVIITGQLAGPQEGFVPALRQLCVSFASAAPACVSGRAEVLKRPRRSSRAATKQRRPTDAGKSWSRELSAALRSEAAESPSWSARSQGLAGALTTATEAAMKEMRRSARLLAA